MVLTPTETLLAWLGSCGASVCLIYQTYQGNATGVRGYSNGVERRAEIYISSTGETAYRASLTDIKKVSTWAVHSEFGVRHIASWLVGSFGQINSPYITAAK